MSHTPTFRERVLDFWQWFPTVADALTQTIGGDQSVAMEELGTNFSNDVREKIGGLSWVFGPGKSEGRLSFTVSGEGQRSRQLLSHFWLEQAVDVSNWDFYCSRQPSPHDQLNMEIEVGGLRVGFDSLMIAPEVDEEDQCVNIKAWHPAFENLEVGKRFQILYLLLDEALGEYGTQMKIGNIGFQEEPNAIPLAEIPKFIDTLWLEKGWEEASPLETYSAYQSTPSSEFERADTVTGYTCIPNLVLGYLNNKGELEEDPVKETGAQFIYVTLEKCGLDQMEDPLKLRSEVETDISKRLKGGGGYVVGGATGLEKSYIDMVIFDGERSLAAIRESMSELNLEEQYKFKYFAGQALTELP